MNYDAKAFTYIQRISWTLLLAIIAVITIIGASVQFAHHHGPADTTNERQHFYAMIDGRAPTDGSTVDVALATDLKTALGAHDGHPLPADIINFQGTSSSYGGITAAIGFDPFNNAGQTCTECGPLTDQMLTTLRTIKSGHDTNLFQTAHHLRPHGYTLTPGGMPWITWLLLIWLSGTLNPLVTRILRPQEYAAARNHPTAEMWLSSPLYWGIVSITNHNRTRTTDQKIRAAFPEQMATIEAVNRVLAHTTGTKADQLRQVRDQVMGQLQAQVQSGSPSDDLELRQTMQQLGNALEFLKARAQAKAELGESENH